MKENLTVPIGHGRKVEGLRGVKAYASGVPGLVIHRRAVKAPHKRTPWVVTHEGSQYALPGKFRTRESAAAAVAMVSDLDWTQPAEFIASPTSRGYVEDSYCQQWLHAMRRFYNGER